MILRTVSQAIIVMVSFRRRANERVVPEPRVAIGLNVSLDSAGVEDAPNIDRHAQTHTSSHGLITDELCTS